MRIIYIAGPMTGLPDFNKPAFFAAEEKLREQGMLAINPAKHEMADPTWERYMRMAIVSMLKANEIALLPGWQDSRGAKLELLIAQNVGMPSWDYRDGTLHECGTTPSLDAYGELPVPTIKEPN